MVKLMLIKWFISAETWVNVKPQAWYYSDIIEVNQTITTGQNKRLLPT